MMVHVVKGLGEDHNKLTTLFKYYKYLFITLLLSWIILYYYSRYTIIIYNIYPINLFESIM